jgi:polysaccharide biosynthesis protein PelF
MRASLAKHIADANAAAAPVDVCLIVEGCYPYVPGGVSSWVDWLMRYQADLTFSVVAISSGNEPRQSRYPRLPNQIDHHDLILNSATIPGKPRRRAIDPRGVEALASVLRRFVKGGGLAEFRELLGIVEAPGRELSLYDLLESREALEVVRLMYAELMPHASFLQFYWAWRALFGGLFATLKFPLQHARTYHTISTGYAGLLAARAAIRTGRPAIISEHGIYTNERRIEILMADWISDTVDKGLNIDDARMDLRDLWISAFEAYARTCYQACAAITTLYGDNQALQLSLGADSSRLRVIANGIDVDQFGEVPVAACDARPTIALIGRVVPIKDTQTFIAAAAGIRRSIPQLRALVMGPLDEDPGYVAECRRLVEELGLQDCVEFTGSVRVKEWLSQIHVVVLTSLSEAQPLVLLEAGAAGIPCVATNVGACREIIDGAGGDQDPHDPGGFVTDVVATSQVVARVCELLGNHALRERYGGALRRRVRRLYTTRIAQANYLELYRGIIGGSPVQPVVEG